MTYRPDSLQRVPATAEVGGRRGGACATSRRIASASPSLLKVETVVSSSWGSLAAIVMDGWVRAASRAPADAHQQAQWFGAIQTLANCNEDGALGGLRAEHGQCVVRFQHHRACGRPLVTGCGMGADRPGAARGARCAGAG